MQRHRSASRRDSVLERAIVVCAALAVIASTWQLEATPKGATDDGAPHPDGGAKEPIGSDALRPEEPSAVDRVGTHSRASYELRATLKPDSTEQLEGSGTIQFENRSAQTITELYLHLYLNAFKNNQTLFSRSPFISGRSGNKPEAWGYTEVEALIVAGEDLWPGREYPKDADETNVRVLLPEPVPPGASLKIEMRWRSKLPTITERTGTSRSFFFLAQWFPKLAKLEPDGTFAHFAFHPQAEFYADFGDYDVEIDVPTDYIVGASGERTEELNEPDRKRVRHRASNVHDFAWTAWPEFLTHREQIAGVAVRVLFPPGHEANLERTLSALRFGLPHYGERYGNYPYPNLTIVHPPKHAKDAGGMEYPTLITTGGKWSAGLFSRSVELVTLHELAHQWFYGLLASNEARYPFLDEGLASYAELVATDEWLGRAGAVDRFGLTLSVEALHRVGALRTSTSQPIAIPAEEFASFGALGSLVYSRTATLLRTLQKVYGDEAMVRALATYTRDHRFSHPKPDDLLDALERELGAEARQQAERGLFDKGWVDYELAEISTVRRTPARGFFGSGDELAERDDGEDEDAPHLNQILVLRHGTLEFPVTITLTEESGTITRKRWDGKGDTLQLWHESDTPVVEASVDEERTVLLDDDLLNNAKITNPPPPLRSFERLSYWAAILGRYVGP